MLPNKCRFILGSLLAAAAIPSCASPPRSGGDLPEGYLALERGDVVVEFRPEHEEVACRVLREAVAWRKRYLGEYVDPLRSHFERFQRWLGADEPVTDDRRGRIIDVIAKTFIDPGNLEASERFRSIAERCSLIAARVIPRKDVILESLRAVERFLTVTASRGRFRLITGVDLEEGRIPGFSRSADGHFRFASGFAVMEKDGVVFPTMTDLPDYVPVLLESDASSYSIVLENLAELLAEEDFSEGVAGEDPYLLIFFVAHEVAEMSLMYYLELGDPFRRWFADGCANHAALKCIGTIFGVEAIEQAHYGPRERKRYEESREEVNLLAWMAHEWEKKYPELEPAEEGAHYAFATAEIEALVASHGEAALRRVIAGLAASRDKDQRALRTAFVDATGWFDPWDRLRAYSIAAARRLAGTMPEIAVEVNDVAEWLHLAMEERQRGDLEKAWRILQVPAALEPADLQVRMARAVVLAERDGRTDLRSVQRELAILSSQLRDDDSVYTPRASLETFETLLQAAADLEPRLSGLLLEALLLQGHRPRERPIPYRDLQLGEETVDAWVRAGWELLN